MGIGKKLEARRQEKYEKRKIATGKAAKNDTEAKEALAKKMASKNPGPLTKAERKLAERTGQGEAGSED